MYVQIRFVCVKNVWCFVDVCETMWMCVCDNIVFICVCACVKKDGLIVDGWSLCCACVWQCMFVLLCFLFLYIPTCLYAHVKTFAFICVDVYVCM